MKKLILALGGCFSVLALSAVEPVIEFKLNEGSGSIVRDTGGTVDGKIINPQNTQWAPGREADVPALHFTGVPKKARNGGAVQVDLKKKVDFSKPFTVMFYFFVDKTLPRTSHSELVSCARMEKGPGFRTLFSWNRLCFWIGDGKKRTELNTNANKVRIPRGVWNHAAFTYANGKVEIYFNGIRAAVSDKMLPIAANHYPLAIGSYGRGAAYSFKGAISEVKIFDRVLTDREILSMVKDIK